MIMEEIVQIENIILGKEIAEARFACDLFNCKGACCTLESNFGAPLLEEEVEQISENLELIKEYLPARHWQVIGEKGFFERKQSGLMTMSIDNKACVFVNYEGEVAKCGIEKVFLAGKTNFRKPISCHLFPLRVENFGGDVLRYERFEECSPAVKKGEEENIKLIDFLKESLTRKYGKEWFLKLKGLADSKDVNT
jgi:hypothetical protein